MRIQPIQLLVSLITVLTLAACDRNITAGKSDAERIRDVHTIANIVEQFKEKTGHYPYEENFSNVRSGYVAVPISVNITDKALPEQYRYPPPGFSGGIIPNDEFLAYLRESLGPNITLPYDDAPLPRFYQYHFDGKNYFVSAVLYAPNEFTRMMRENWHKYQVGSVSNPQFKIRLFKDIK